MPSPPQHRGMHGTIHAIIFDRQTCHVSMRLLTWNVLFCSHQRTFILEVMGRHCGWVQPACVCIVSKSGMGVHLSMWRHRIWYCNWVVSEAFTSYWQLFLWHKSIIWCETPALDAYLKKLSLSVNFANATWTLAYDSLPTDTWLWWQLWPVALTGCSSQRCPQMRDGRSICAEDWQM